MNHFHNGQLHRLIAVSLAAMSEVRVEGLRSRCSEHDPPHGNATSALRVPALSKKRYLGDQNVNLVRETPCLRPQCNPCLWDLRCVCAKYDISQHAGGQTQDYRMGCCGLAESSCSSFRPQDYLQDYAFFSYDLSTCMYYDHSTCMYYDHSICMYYDHSRKYTIL